jgi:hypothetical protein
MASGDEIVQMVQDLGLQIALLIFEGKHDEAKRASEVMVAQGELMRGMYQDDMSPEELEMYRERLNELINQ